MVLSRYVLKEHVVPFVFGLSVIMFLLVVDLILQKMDLMLGKGIAPGVVLELFLLNTAWMIALAVPMAVLVATLMAFGRLSADGEISAMQALGIGVFRVILPVFFSGAALALGLVVFNDRVLPEFNYRARMLMGDIQRKRPTVALEDRSGVFIQDFANYRILIGDIDRRTSMLKDVLIYRYEAGGYPVSIAAETGQVRIDSESDEALVTLENGEWHRVDREDPDVYIRARFQKKILRLGEAGRQLIRTMSHYRTDREMGLGAMMERVDAHQREASALQAEAADSGGAALKRLLFEPGTERRPVGIVADLARKSRTDAAIRRHKLRQADRYRVEIHKKLSIPVACIVFVVIGAPLGIRVRGSSPAVGAGISIGFFLLWWLCLISGETLADRGYVSPWVAMWSPNLLVLSCGAWLVFGTVLEWRIGRWRRQPCAS
ncbi:MAG: LptF/LptG family permease [Gemmatimonadetes bacterium]|nr:LptF/LptG family permease [Gemmatimonadota bacterium]